VISIQLHNRTESQTTELTQIVLNRALNNAIIVSHRPTRKREKIFGRFKSHRQARRFLSARDQINLIFRLHRYQHSAASYRDTRSDAFSLWADDTAEMAA
jgi:putative transposase